ncbi:hypothetical protein DdX_03306 [Ditylenchus destructor]|uniref:Uncharacterized protein n=1 Tax=Ditylenchus destructor TaxID=166010 RepID=A0AAD4NG01_9BILA|nr:hypothetical protein DdX_03306 [Ditylenchus destructor]
MDLPVGNPPAPTPHNFHNCDRGDIEQVYLTFLFWWEGLIWRCWDETVLFCHKEGPPTKKSLLARLVPNARTIPAYLPASPHHCPQILLSVDPTQDGPFRLLFPKQKHPK